MTVVYHRREYRVPEAREEAFTAELWARGILGCEIKKGGEIEVYFPDPLPSEVLEWDLTEWMAQGVEVIDQAIFEERDWLEDYRASARPIEVGRKFLIDPRDESGENPPSADGRILFHIPARTAFGTGSHESTRLAAQWLEDLDITGLDVLDVGTGSGILTFMAAKLGARRVVGFDMDPAAPVVAHQNRDLNRRQLGGFRPLLYAGRLDALKSVPAFDLALVNVLPERIFGEFPRLLAVLRPGALVVSSGNLWQRRLELREQLESLGLVFAGQKRGARFQDGDEWIAFLLRKP